ncbi:uncharacterized protein P174DRAFT_32048 [Aspergillus novofumigatus IBT 16806]|uniref:Uncharacterized protein n=1 Tax=Aspergillus novofumigatus (strain IBT 16806) TaxID=1392255 RepID=A0A2I1CML7_ASPN1|nr:uncharacterized protein P174DRAFT_32048 [Aspergillus novofumigatus IBT 16806]PKX98866.1 hypothetical protein P174DRAFT_32048 [Aspergillus novofumigatus IBT 16806]
MGPSSFRPNKPGGYSPPGEFRWELLPLRLWTTTAQPEAGSLHRSFFKLAYLICLGIIKSISVGFKRMIFIRQRMRRGMKEHISPLHILAIQYSNTP